MPLGDLLGVLERDAAVAADRVLSEARARAAEIQRAAAEQMATRRAERLSDRDAVWRADTERALAGARHAARVRVLTAREQLFDRLFSALRARLPALLEHPAYRARLSDAVRAALTYLEGDAAGVRCTPALTAVLREFRAVGDLSVGSGVVITSADGVIDIDVTLEHRLVRDRQRLAAAALRWLEQRHALPVG